MWPTDAGMDNAGQRARFGLVAPVALPPRPVVMIDRLNLDPRTWS